MRDDYARFGNRHGSSDSPSRRPNQDSRDANSHPGMANYPTGSSNRYLPPLGDERRERVRRQPPPEQDNPQKLTVTRVAAMRSREMGSRMYGLFHKAATADGADKSGLTALTYPVMANFAVDAAKLAMTG